MTKRNYGECPYCGRGMHGPNGECPNSPKTELGKLALEARKKYIDGGGKLLSDDEINERIGR